MLKEAHGYRIGQEGKFINLDAFGRPKETVRGKIIFLVEVQGHLYVLIETPSGDQALRLD